MPKPESKPLVWSEEWATGKATVVQAPRKKKPKKDK